MLALFGLEVGEVQVERFNRDMDFAHRIGQGNEEGEQTEAEDVTSGYLLAQEDQKHADAAEEQAEDADLLHLADETDPFAQMLNLHEEARLRLAGIALMQRADEVRQSQETVGVGQHQQGNGGKKQSRRGELDIHEASATLPPDAGMITSADILAASTIVFPQIYRSPCAYSQTLSAMTGLRVHLKLENLQMTGSFKERGALYRLSRLSEAERACGVITASAGNHAQGVAYHAKRLGIQATVVMPEKTPLVKVSATQRHGARIVMHGSSYDEACERAHEIARAEGQVFVHAFDDEAVIAGQGTLGVELLEQQPDLEALVVPIGGGGLIAGIATYVKEQRPTLRVIGVQTARIPSAKAALDAGHPLTLPRRPTLADGIAVRRVGEHTFPLIQRYVDEVVTVEEDEIARAIVLLLEREKTVAEGAGAAALAALLRLEIQLPDQSGSLHTLVGFLASAQANILDIHHVRAFSGLDLGEAIVDLTIETRGPEHAESILRAIDAAGYERRGRQR